jgi:hypothetical protein
MALAPPPPLIGRLYQGWLVIEILQLIGSSWLIHSQPAKFQSSLFSTIAKGFPLRYENIGIETFIFLTIKRLGFMNFNFLISP